MNIRISQEENSELPVICNLIEAAFADMQESDHQEHHLVDKLHKSDTYIPELSLVAKTDQEEIVGYILLTKVEIVSESEVHTSLAVAPLAVLPEYQNRGIGEMLLKEAHKRAAALGYGTTVLLGHKDYYPRFGYRKAADYDITFPFDVPSETLSIPSKTVLLEEGKVADRLYLIRKGCLRLFFYNEGKDITFQFFFEGDFVASFDSLYKDTPSLFSLESIEPSEVLFITKEDFYKKIGSDPSLRTLYEEKIIERFSFYQHLFLSRIKNTPQQRYEELLKEYPNIIQRVPQHYIASYLGITPVSLSRIRNRR